MAASTTIQDLPDDMLHEIFGHVFPGELEKDVLPGLLPPQGAHLALRCVCRRWRNIADWVWLSMSNIIIDTSRLADVGAVRARHPAAFKRLALLCTMGGHTTSVSRAAASLINGSADLRRALSVLELYTCCLPSLSPAVTTIPSCTALTALRLMWGAHKRERVVPSNMLAPLSALRMLKELVYAHHVEAGALPTSALLALLPALPDAPRLTRLDLGMAGNFVPVGSDAALGQLRRLHLKHLAPVQELLDADDPFLLHTAFDAGTWQPSRLTGLQQLTVNFDPVRGDLRAPLRPSPTGSRAGSEWAPLADQITALTVNVNSRGFKRPSTGIVAGLGALTALRVLHVMRSSDCSPDSIARPGWLEPVSFDRVRAPNLVSLKSDCVTAPASVARFPELVALGLESVSSQPPLNLRSLVARSSLKRLALIIRSPSPGSLNLAELFVGGGGWPVLGQLALMNIVLEWDETGLAGAPTAVEFAERARQLLPVRADVVIEEPHGRGALPDRSRVGFVVACRRHVVPALLGLHADGD